MHTDLEKILKKIRDDKNFDPNLWIQHKVNLLNNYMTNSKLENCVVSVSGGIDSTVTLYLAIEASKQPNSPIKNVYALAQPIHSTESIQNRVYELAHPVITIDQTLIHTQIVNLVRDACVKSKLSIVQNNIFAEGQLRSYMRTPINYYFAQLVGKCIVLGTGNKDEDGYLGYFCKAGDGVVDVQLISDLHKSEVFAIGRQLNIPSSILNAPPSADLWEGQTDEGEMGVTYDFVELYTTLLGFDKKYFDHLYNELEQDTQIEFDKYRKIVDDIHNRNKHKLNGIVNL